ncbi:MAG: FAD-dependent oxidoreductase [Candidatus Omnitrophica bacterium]|nr:FAD-dependent oxidoreductase [Candidatus Omnitrophota bacterium]
MNTFSVKLIEKIKRTPSIESFRFKIQQRIDFLPGQFVKVVFDEKDLQNKGINKYLSFSSSPGKDYVEVTKRLSDSAFSAHLKALREGESVLMQGPMGNCIFKEEYKKIGFLIGGIGITPVISILEYILEKKLVTDIILIYSSRNNNEIAFRPELNAWQEANSNLRILYTVTDCRPDDGICLQGRINRDMLRQRVPDLLARKFFIYGPPVMAKAMKDLCIASGCDKNEIMAENFVGY